MYRSDQIDWDDPLTDHPLNKDLVGAWLCGDENPYWGGPKILGLNGRNHGTLTNMLPSSATSGWQGAMGRPGGYGCLAFDGTNDYVSLGTFAAANFTGTDPFSVSFWMWSAEVSGNREVIGNGTFQSSGWYIYTYRSVANFIGLTAATFSGTQAATRIWYDQAPTQSWVHWTVTRLGSSVKIYLNGAEGLYQTTGTHSSITSAAATFTIGRYPPSANDFYQGYLDDMRIWNRALSAGEVADNYWQSRLGHPDTLRRLRRIAYYLPSAPPGGLSIPIAMYHYKRMMGVC